MKFISDDVFSRILLLSKTDFMFFIASSSLRRFADHPYFRKHLAIPKGNISIMDKLGLHSIAELTKYALREGITSLDD